MFSPGVVSATLLFKEVIHVQHQAIRTPPRQFPQANCLALTRLWQALPEETRQQALRILSRVLAQQLPATPVGEEVTHEPD